MKIIDYKYINHVYHDSLAKHIREEIKEGWQPLGTIVQLKCTDVDGFVLVQAMVKYEAFSLSPGHIVSGSHIENAKLKEENEQLKYKLDGNSALIESLQKEIKLLNERAQPRDDALLSSIESNEIYEKIIKDFILSYWRQEDETWVMLNGKNIYQCGTKEHGVECLFNKITKKYRMDKANENNK